MNRSTTDSTLVSDADFPNYTQLPAYVPVPVWHALRVLSILAALALIAVLLWRPALGLTLLWGIVVPIVPLVFMLVPGLWRNVCPFAALNQVPRLFGYTRGLTRSPRSMEFAYLLGIVALIVLVATRKSLFNDSGAATAALILGMMVLAFLGGVIFKGKSGWCSSVCPLLPVQRLYGQTPFVAIANTHCQPCVGCTKNCYDFNPRVAYIADQYDGDRHYVAYRRVFAGIFPGFVVAYFSLPDSPELLLWEVYAQFGAYMASSLAVFAALDAFVKTSLIKLPALFGFVAFNLYYWYSAPILAKTTADLTGAVYGEWQAWAIRAAIGIVTLVWLARTFGAERRFLLRTADNAVSESARLGIGATAALASAGKRAVEVRFVPEGRCVLTEPDCTLLEVAERGGLPIEAGCRMGVCGSDPVAVVDGIDRLTPVSAEERTTLDRLGYAPNTRMACCARVRGAVSVKLRPDRAGAAGTAAVTRFDKSIKCVVVIGNGIAGVTAADYARRTHPECEIHLIGRERHPLYNRMGITRLIYGRSAMQGLYLLQENWYEGRKITSWLNTHVEAIDLVERKVKLGTWEQLRYDRLVLATGGRGVLPEVKGFGAAGCFALRDAEDAMRVREYVQRRHARRAVVAGGGLLGLETADGLRQLGLHVTVLERGDFLLRRQVDERGARLLQRYLEGLGITVLCGASASMIESGPGGVRGVFLADRRVLPAQVFIACAGMSPNVELAAAAGIRVDDGVIVNDRMQSSAPEVYAAGDVAQHEGRVYGLWPASVTQGETAGVNAAGGNRVYSGSIPVTILKITGAELLSVGRIVPREGDEVLVHETAGEYRYAKLVIEGDRIAGAVMIGYGREAALVSDAVKDARPVRALLEQLGAGDFSGLAARSTKLPFNSGS